MRLSRTIGVTFLLLIAFSTSALAQYLAPKYRWEYSISPPSPHFESLDETLNDIFHKLSQPCPVYAFTGSYPVWQLILRKDNDPGSCMLGIDIYAVCDDGRRVFQLPEGSNGLCPDDGGPVDLYKTAGPNPDDCTGNPCTPGTGNKVEIGADYIGPGPFPLYFARTYNAAPPNYGVFGRQWRHSYDRRLSRLYDLNGPAPWMAVYRPTGEVVTYSLSGGVWIAPADVFDRLEELVDSQGATTGWRLTVAEDDTAELYSADGVLQSITSREGLVQTLTYFPTGPQQGLLQQVADHFGRTITFSYLQGFLQSITIPGGQQIQYHTDGRLRAEEMTHVCS